MIKDTKYKIPITEKVCVLIERTLDKFLKIPAFQRYVNRRANDKYGSTYVTHGGNGTIDDVFKDYHFTDIQQDDIVLDIGANIGAFSMFVSKFTHHVYAVEPMLFEILRQNVVNNNIKNISVIPDALGIGVLEIPWVGFKNRHIVGKSLSELIFICGGKVDFIKTDCEGGEWCIKSENLKNVRRIEAEVHNFDGTHNLSDFLKMLDEANFEYTYTTPRGGILIVHAKNKTL